MGWETILGHWAPEESAVAQYKRYKVSECDKPARPTDDRFARILAKYNKEHPKQCNHLTKLRGITRTARYRSAADKIIAAMGKRGGKPVEEPRKGRRGGKQEA